MKKTLLALGLILSMAASVQAIEINQASILYGKGSVSNAALLSTLDEYGVDLDAKITKDLFLSTGFRSGEASASGLSRKLTQLRLGLRQYKSLSKETSFFYGLGLTSLTEEISAGGVSATGDNTGFFAEIGAKYNFKNNVFLGTRVDLFSANSNTVTHYSINLGYNF